LNGSYVTPLGITGKKDLIPSQSYLLKMGLLNYLVAETKTYSSYNKTNRYHNKHFGCRHKILFSSPNIVAVT